MVSFPFRFISLQALCSMFHRGTSQLDMTSKRHSFQTEWERGKWNKGNLRSQMESGLWLEIGAREMKNVRGKEVEWSGNFGHFSTGNLHRNLVWKCLEKIFPPRSGLSLAYGDLVDFILFFSASSRGRRTMTSNHYRKFAKHHIWGKYFASRRDPKGVSKAIWI